MRCPNGTRKNKHGVCTPKGLNPILTRCPKGMKKYRDICIPKGTKKRCPNGTRKNKQGDCVPHSVVVTPQTTAYDPLEHAVMRIQRFMNRTKHKRREMYLKSICSEAGVCIAFGIEAVKIKEYFRNFSFVLVDRIKKIGAPSANGFVNELQYTKRGYNAYAVLKSSTSFTADNLMYEYRVGQFLNKMSFLFPCFLETYGLFKYKSSEKWLNMKTNSMTPDVFRTLLVPQPFDLKVGCSESRYMAVLIQHIRGCKTVKEILNEHTFQHILPILFQVYYPLFHMRKKFTHYDLHMENVVLYEPVPGKYIQFHYQTETGVISFKSPYIVKIIDYGRSYIHDGETSKDIYEQVCQLDECKPKCGEYNGFSTFPLSNKRDFYHIVSQKKNESHDLRFLNSVLKELKKISTPVWFKEYTNSINLKYDHMYGTAEKSCKRKQCDIEGVYKKLSNLIPLSNVQLDEYHTVKYGDLHIYGDKPIAFIKI
uniref:Protein kinase domain-containing protein n=1 Tax=viral metagenome TaxID=1070528 RepID=A0A6C0JZW4_9ZZZZ